MVETTVSDTGIGREYLPTLFEPFTNSGVKPRRLGRGYKPRKPGADFI